MPYIGGIQIDNGTQLAIGSTLYGYSNSTALEATKVVVMPNFGTLISTGITVHIKFNYANSITENLYLKVGDAPAKPITNGANSLTWPANTLLSFTYDGDNWVMNDNKDVTIDLVDTYSPTGTSAVTGKAIAAALGTLDVNDIEGFGPGKTLLTLTEADGKISATFQNIRIASSAISDLADVLTDTALTGTPTAPTASTGTSTTQIATTQFVINEIASKLASQDVMLFKGLLDSSTNPVNNTESYRNEVPYIGYQAGWTYKVNRDGTYAGQVCEVGDLVIAIADGPASSDRVTNSHWVVAQTNIDGAVTGPSSSTANHIATFDGTSGKIIKDSGYTIETSVPSGALFTDHQYQAVNNANAYTGHAIVEAGTEGASTLATVSQGVLRLSGGIKFTTTSVTTGISEVQ